MPKTQFLKPASVAREIKVGARGDNVRVTKEATKLVVEEGKRILKLLGEFVRKTLEVSKKKTVTRALLAYGVSSCESNCVGCSRVQALAGTNKRTKNERREIATASAVRCFALGAPLGGKNGFQITKSARDSLSLIIVNWIHTLGRDAKRYAKASRRTTIKASDISAVLEQRYNR